jgi:hypothetical protein
MSWRFGWPPRGLCGKVFFWITQAVLLISVHTAFLKGNPIVLEPLMKVEVQVPEEFQGGFITF